MLRIGIMFGNKSCEHEISIITAFQVLDYLNQYKVDLLYYDKFKKLYLANDLTLDDFKNQNFKKLKKIELTENGYFLKKKKIILDSVIIANHGMNGEEGLSATLLDYYDIAYVGSDAITSGIFMDKSFTHDLLKSSDILVTNSITYTYQDYLDDVLIPFEKYIVKPSRSGSSIGISLVKNENEKKDALSLGFSYEQKLIIEELLEDFDEYCVAVCSYKVSNVEKIIKEEEFFSFESKYENRCKDKNHFICEENELTKKLQEIAKTIYKKSQAKGIIRVDFMVKDNTIYTNEINTIPGALSYYLFDDFKNVMAYEIERSIIRKNQSKKFINSYHTNLLKISSIKK